MSSQFNVLDLFLEFRVREVGDCGSELSSDGDFSLETGGPGR